METQNDLVLSPLEKVEEESEAVEIKSPDEGNIGEYVLINSRKIMFLVGGSS